jgi:hypothetical protein
MKITAVASFPKKWDSEGCRGVDFSKLCATNRVESISGVTRTDKPL